MFIGHFGVAFAAKKSTPKTSLGVLLAASLFLDLLWSSLLLLGFEHARIVPGITRAVPLEFYDYPFSHSLLAVLVWGVAFSGMHWILKKNSRAAVVLGLCVVSHWLLDLLVHRPDLPVVPGEGDIRLGLGLWNHPWSAHVLEVILFLGGAWSYWKSFRPETKGTRVSFISLALTLFGIWIANLVGPPPPTIAVVAATGLSQWGFVLWAWQLDRRTTANSGR